MLTKEQQKIVDSISGSERSHYIEFTLGIKAEQPIKKAEKKKKVASKKKSY